MLYLVACLKLRKSDISTSVCAVLEVSFSLLRIRPYLLWPQIPSPSLTHFLITWFTRLLGSAAAARAPLRGEAQRPHGESAIIFSELPQ